MAGRICVVGEVAPRRCRRGGAYNVGAEHYNADKPLPRSINAEPYMRLNELFYEAP